MCSRCETTRYCSVRCQRADYRLHRHECMPPLISEDEVSVVITPTRLTPLTSRDYYTNVPLFSRPPPPSFMSPSGEPYPQALTRSDMSMITAGEPRIVRFNYPTISREVSGRLLVSPLPLADSTERGTCCVCLDDDVPSVIECCRAHIHRECLERWLATSRSCPYCRNTTSFMTTTVEDEKKMIADAISPYGYMLPDYSSLYPSAIQF